MLWHSIDWNLRFRVGHWKEKSVWSIHIEATAEVTCCLMELLLLINLMRHHHELKCKEVLCLLMLILFWLVNLGPNLIDVNSDIMFDLLFA